MHIQILQPTSDKPETQLVEGPRSISFAPPVKAEPQPLKVEVNPVEPPPPLLERMRVGIEQPLELKPVGEPDVRVSGPESIRRSRGMLHHKMPGCHHARSSAPSSLVNPRPRSGSAYGAAFAQTSSSGNSLTADTPAEAYRQLIASDIRTAYGREATQQDYEYWMPKLQGDCDSGFVTGGQMSGTEYWHRRMLGWQAGGSDQALFGPYAGSSDAHGPVPAATDVVANVPPGGINNMFPAETLISFRSLIDTDLRTAYGRPATEEDYAYWLPKFLGPCDSGFVTSGQMTGTEYYHRRLLGWQAGGADVALFGPYAGGSDAQGPVPAATDLVPNLPTLGFASAFPPEAVDMVRTLIDRDLQMAYGRSANDEDYNYWLPKFFGPCDSGFVTSGQMTAPEYWHRRLLGWQAGGADVALYGPYAGGSDASGPVPSALDMLGGDRR